MGPQDVRFIQKEKEEGAVLKKMVGVRRFELRTSTV